MKIVIDIPIEAFNYIKDNKQLGWLSDCELAEAIANGAPLPKNHGRLIDADVLVEGMGDNYELCMEVNATPTISPSEREEEV